MKLKKTLWVLGLLAATMVAYLVFSGSGCCDPEEETDEAGNVITTADTPLNPPTDPVTNPTEKPTEKPTEAAPAAGNAPYLEQVHWDHYTNEDGSDEPFVMAPTLLPAGIEFSDIYIFRGDSTDDKDLIGIQTGQKDVDVMYNPEPEKDGRQWAKFAGKIYWFDKPENIPKDDDIVTVVVTGFDRSKGEETPYSNKITAKWKDLQLK